MNTTPTCTLLILGGTSEGYALAAALAARPGLRVISSLAGRTDNPRLPAGETRIGGFGGADGLAAFLQREQVDAVVDATHPFAAQMGWNAAAGCRMAGVPLVRLARPAWRPGPGDRWESVADWTEAVATLGRLGARRVLLALGRQELEPFAVLDGVSFLIRCVTPPHPLPTFRAAEVLLARGPFDLTSERALLAGQRIDCIVCKNSGGGATDAKLAAARELGIRVVMRERPARPAVAEVADVAAALAWIDGVLPPGGAAGFGSGSGSG